MGLRVAMAVTALLAGISSAVLAGQAGPDNQVARQVRGTWKAPNGTCDAAYFKSGELTKTVRGENAIDGTVTNAGMTVMGQLITQGARIGQIVNPMNDMMMFLFEPQDGADKMKIIPLGGPALGWPEVMLDLCPGSR